MTDRIRELRAFFIERKAHHALRQPPIDAYEMAERFHRENTPALERSVSRLLYMMENEKPVVFPEERIAFMRTIPVLPELYTKEEIDELKKTHWLHEQGEVCNINVDYRMLMTDGFDAKRRELRKRAAQFAEEGEAEKQHYLLSQE